MTEEQYKTATKLIRWKKHLDLLICGKGTCVELSNALVKICDENADFKREFDELIRKYRDSIQKEYDNL